MAGMQYLLKIETNFCHKGIFIISWIWYNGVFFIEWLQTNIYMYLWVNDEETIKR